MTIISKVLAVLVTAACLAFLGFVAITLRAGTNWEAHARQVAGYVFTTTEGSENQPATYRADPTQIENPLPAVSSTPVLPEAIIRAQKNIAERNQQEIETLDQQIAEYEQAIAGFHVQTDLDLKALAAREKEIAELLDQTQKQIVELQEEVDSTGQQTRKILSTTRDQRDDATRLEAQLAAIQAEKHRWQAQKVILEDRLVRLKQSIQSLERRQTRLSDAAPAASGR